ncbi:unnamed protein product [Polarella glacialis]|uniref:Beta-ketoacyl synthase C-terminal domain-containing protein n=1 Tax=Polarella glacialis TaxID=89957 RepID=A0A813ER69_POLGL|nr:unnamed protein product [Polarella glacialis]
MEPRSSPLALTSSKSNLGHLEGCAGIAGLLKCVMMLLAGVCPPNCHLWQLNPHLSVDGFPCHFETEAVDSNLNSSLTGVSSFGFGGTNGRCDVWGHARSGVRKAGKLNPRELDQIYAICPVTLGRIDYITGEPVVNRRAGHRRKHRADVLRDDFASYELSRYVYDGGFRYRRKELPLEQEAEDLEPDSSVFICGSWSGFREMEEMERNGAGMFSAQIVLGEGRYELFELCINRSQELAIYPTIDRASQILCVEGPDANGRGRRWLIDGRDAQVPAGTVFHVTFDWGQDRKELSWNQVSETRLGMALPHRHTYYVVGSFSHPERRLTALSLADDGSDSWEGAFRIGPKGHEEFQFLRDGDLQQAVYPAMPKAASGNDSASWTTLASLARGPDELGKNRHFLVQGVPGEQVRLRLSVVDAEVLVTATSAASAGPPREWRSLSGWARHQYSVVGSSNDGLHIPMVMDPSRPGVFTSVVTMREVFSEEQAAFCDTFQVAVDYDKRLVFYPEVPGSSSGEAIVLRPDAKAVGSEHVFVVRSRTPGRTFQVTLDLTAEDRRQTVSWAWVDRPKRDRFQGLAGVAASV